MSTTPTAAPSVPPSSIASEPQPPKGFSYAGIHAGIKAARKDLALIASEVDAVAAGVFTQNRARAACVEDAAARLPCTGIRAIVIHSGNANALTGPRGVEAASRVRTAIAQALDVPIGSVLGAATGVIGVYLPVETIERAASRLVESRRTFVLPAAEAIFTTDTRVKLSAHSAEIGGKTVTFQAFAKGSGMIAPALATVLAFLTTDLAITKGALQHVVRQAADATFNLLNIDGETSTNDAVIALANGLADNGMLDEASPELSVVTQIVTSMFAELARAIAKDGEGATKLLEVRVTQAPTQAIARDFAKAVAGSTLVKASVFGADPNWGRVLATLGARASRLEHNAVVDPMRADIVMMGVSVFADGAPTEFSLAGLRSKMRAPEILIEVSLNQGTESSYAFGCDLSYDYVKINADYMALTVSSEQGVVSRDDRLTNYSPGFKRALLVEALSYIRRFAGTRAVVKCGGAPLLKDSLKNSFATDVNLLRSAGLLPIVIHGGGPEVASTLDRMGGTTGDRIVEGIRVTDQDDQKLVEMVLTGRINAEIVSLLNQESAAARAVGVSGKDGGLLRVRRIAAEAGRDLGHAGEVTSVNSELLELLLGKAYVPVISPIGLGEDGGGYNINADAAAAEVAIAVGAQKLIFLTDAPGILQDGELLSELTGGQLQKLIDRGVITGTMATKCRSILRALSGGVQRVHIVDGRVPHSLVAELFTDHGVGTLITP